jgi:hypothetical protein
VQYDINSENPAQLDLCLHDVAPILTCSDNALIKAWTGLHFTSGVLTQYCFHSDQRVYGGMKFFGLLAASLGLALRIPSCGSPLSH